LESLFRFQQQQHYGKPWFVTQVVRLNIFNLKFPLKNGARKSAFRPAKINSLEVEIQRVKNERF